MKIIWRTALLLALTVTTPALAGQKPGATGTDEPRKDKAFMIEAAQGGLAEIELGRLAEERSTNAEVKELGQRMVMDHTKANGELRRIALIKDVTLPSKLTKKDQAERDHLASLSGDAFDRAYLNLMVTDHTQDIREFQTESTIGRDPDLQTFVHDTLPTLEQHLRLAQSTRRTVVTTNR